MSCVVVHFFYERATQVETIIANARGTGLETAPDPWHELSTYDWATQLELITTNALALVSIRPLTSGTRRTAQAVFKPSHLLSSRCKSGSNAVAWSIRPAMSRLPEGAYSRASI